MSFQSVRRVLWRKEVNIIENVIQIAWSCCRSAFSNGKLFLGPSFQDGTKGKVVWELYKLLPTHPVTIFARRNP